MLLSRSLKDLFFEGCASIVSKPLLGVIGEGVDWEREDCESRRTS